MATYTLLRSEAEDLVEHLAERVDIWQRLPGGVFVRCSHQDVEEFLCSVQVATSSAADRFELRTKHISWTSAELDEYISFLLRNYTWYEERMRLEELLADIVRVDIAIDITSVAERIQQINAVVNDTKELKERVIAAYRTAQAQPAQPVRSKYLSNLITKGRVS